MLAQSNRFVIHGSLVQSFALGMATEAIPQFFHKEVELKCFSLNCINHLATFMQVIPTIKSKLWETCQKWQFKALKNTFKPVKYCYFFCLIYNSSECFKMNKILQYISKHFTKPAQCICTTSGTIFRADVWINGGQVIFQYKPGAYL